MRKNSRRRAKISDDTPTYRGPANFRITVLKERKTNRRSVELHVPGFFTWEMDPERARELGQEMNWAAADALAAVEDN